MNNFGERLKIAFGHARNAEIARKLRISEPAVKKYLSGSMPSLENLVAIKNLTGRSLDWLITGEEATLPKPSEDALIQRLREIVREELSEVGGEVGPIEPAEMILAPVVARISGAEPIEEKEYSHADIQKMIEKDDIDEIERRLKPKRRRTG